MSVDERTRRVGLNEAVFRTVNERLEGLNQTFGPVTGRMELVCECADPSCAQMISLTEAEYESVRAEPDLFAVVPGHVAEDVERVVRGREGYDVVRKHPGKASRIAEATDPRTP